MLSFVFFVVQVWLGGSPGNTRTAYTFLERMKDAKMEETVEPILRYGKYTMFR